MVALPYFIKKIIAYQFDNKSPHSKIRKHLLINNVLNWNQNCKIIIRLYTTYISRSRMTY